MSCVVIRSDASLLIGSGHIIRTRTLARKLKEAHNNVIFVCRNQPGDLISLLQEEFDVISLPYQDLTTTVSPAINSLTNQELYAAWLGCTQKTDALNTFTALQSFQVSCIDWIVVDHYGLDMFWETELRNLLQTKLTDIPRFMAIDDLANRPHSVDILLDQNFFGLQTSSRYQNLLPNTCLSLLGPKYALLASEYAELHNIAKPRQKRQRVLISFGGLDSYKCTSLVLQILSTDQFSHLIIDVVLGWQNQYSNEIQYLSEQRPNITLYQGLPSLAALMMKADFAIGACGSTTWERACLGLPSLVIVLADNQIEFAQALSEAGDIILIGHAKDITYEQIYKAIMSYIDGDTLCTSGLHLTDGLGTSRAVSAMLNFE